MMPIRREYNQNWLPSIFSDFFDTDWMPRTQVATPAINVTEDSKQYKVEVAAPGMTKEDFNLHLTDEGQLVISMEKKSENNSEEEKKYLRREFSYSKFEQAMTLPDDVEKEKISAAVNDGVLTIELPKKELVETPRQHRVIEIR